MPFKADHAPTKTDEPKYLRLAHPPRVPNWNAPSLSFLSSINLTWGRIRICRASHLKNTDKKGRAWCWNEKKKLLRLRYEFYGLFSGADRLHGMACCRLNFYCSPHLIWYFTKVLYSFKQTPSLIENYAQPIHFQSSSYLGSAVTSLYQLFLLSRKVASKFSENGWRVILLKYKLLRMAMITEGKDIIIEHLHALFGV